MILKNCQNKMINNKDKKTKFVSNLYNGTRIPYKSVAIE